MFALLCLSRCNCARAVRGRAHRCVRWGEIGRDQCRDPLEIPQIGGVGLPDTARTCARMVSSATCRVRATSSAVTPPASAPATSASARVRPYRSPSSAGSARDGLASSRAETMARPSAITPAGKATCTGTGPTCTANVASSRGSSRFSRTRTAPPGSPAAALATRRRSAASSSR